MPSELEKAADEVVQEMLHEIMEKAAAFDRYVEALDDDGDTLEAQELQFSVEREDPGEHMIRKAAAMDRIMAEFGVE